MRPMDLVLLPAAPPELSADCTPAITFELSGLILEPCIFALLPALYDVRRCIIMQLT